MSRRTSVVLLAVILGTSIGAPAIERTISEQTARRLVEDALPALGENPKYMNIGPWRYYWAPEFYNFSAYRAGGQGVLNIHYLSVNPWTGDVWDAMACKRIMTPELRKEQDAIWQKSGIPSEAREAISGRPPACFPGTARASVFGSEQESVNPPVLLGFRGFGPPADYN